MADRTILLAQNKRHATRGLSVVNPQEFLAYQEDDDNLTYIVDMGAYLDGATIVLVTRTPTGVVISNASNTTTRLTQRLAGYGHVDFRVQTSAGDTEQFRVYIQPRAANPAFFLTAGSGGGITALDGDKGDVIVSSAGSTWTLDATAVASLNVFTDTLKGITPASGGGTSNFLRADGTWATPAGGGGGGSQNVFESIAVSGQSTIVADSTTDTLTFAAGSNIALTTDATTDTLTIATTGLAASATTDATNASNIGSGTLNAARLPQFTGGDVTTAAAGSVNLQIAANAVGTTEIANDAVTYAKIQNVSATDRILGRSTAGAGDIEEITCTAAGRALIDDADATAQRTTLGLGAIALRPDIVNADVNASAAIALSKLATQGARTFVANSAASTAVPTAISVATAQGMIGGFDTVSAVNSATIDAGVNHIRTAGYYATGDGGGALYKRSTGTPTGVGTRYITSNSGTVVWELEPSNFINVRALGASPSASAADNTAAINAAMALGPAYIPPGTYNYTQVGATGVAFTLAAGYQLLATPREVTLVGASGTYETFRVTGSNTRVEGVDFNDAAKTAGAFHHIQCGTSGIEETRVTNMIVYRSTGGAIDSGATTAPYGTHTKTYWEDVVFLGHRGPGFTYTRSFAFLTIGRKCVVDYPQTPTGSENHTAFDYNGANMPAGAGGLILGLEVLGTSGNATTTTSQKGFFIRNTAAVFLLNCRVDNVEGEGIRIEDCSSIYMQDCHVGLCDGHSLIFKNTDYVWGTFSINGRRVAGGGTSKDGLRLEGGCAYYNIKPQIVDVKGNGINISATDDVLHFHDVQILTCEGTGILSASSSTYMTVGGGIISMPGAIADYNLGSTNHRIFNVLGTSGAVINVNNDMARTGVANTFTATQTLNAALAVDIITSRGGAPETTGSTMTTTGARLLRSGTVSLDAGVYTSGAYWLQPRAATDFATNYSLVLCPNGGNIGIGTGNTAIEGALDINSNLFRLRTAKTPSSATDTGVTGQICWDASYFYVCTGTNTWRRVAHSTW